MVSKNLHDHHNNLLGIMLMLVNSVVISILYLAVKDLRQILDSSLIVFIYKLLIFLAIIPWCFYGPLSDMKTKRIWLHMMRGFLSASGSLSLFYGIKFIGLADATAIGYIEQVILVIVGILVFGEFASRAKIIGSIASFIGALIVVYPDLATLDENFVPIFLSHKSLGEFNVYYLFVFFSIIVWSLNCTVIKFLGKTESSKVQMFYGLFFQLAIAFPLAFFNWGNVIIGGVFQIPLPVVLVDLNIHNLDIVHYLLFALLAFCYFVHSITFFLSFKHGEMSVVVPFDYSRLIFTALLAFWILGETPEIGSYVGYFLIAVAGIYIARSEAKRKKTIPEMKIKQLEEELEHA